MIGVNVARHEPKQLKEVMVKEKLSWRSLTGLGALDGKWKPPGTPTFYILDSQGVIRSKWTGSPGAKAIDTALDKLIHEAAKNGKKTPN